MWQNYQIFLWITLTGWLAGIAAIYSGKKRTILGAHLLISAGLVSLGLFLTLLWANLGRPPFKTLGETRLWYAISIALIGYILFLQWKFKWLITYSLLLASIFLVQVSFHPETYDKTLMPALQSVWFIPHVIVYMFAYALLSASAIIGVKGLYMFYTRHDLKDTLVYADNLVYIGFAFLTFGLLFGGLWAKVAWGHYWTWDPKEIWALLTWLVYLVYIHFRHRYKEKAPLPLWILIIALFLVMVCWMGINYLPSAQSSIHTY